MWTSFQGCVNFVSYAHVQGVWYLHAACVPILFQAASRLTSSPDPSNVWGRGYLSWDDRLFITPRSSSVNYHSVSHITSCIYASLLKKNSTGRTSALYTSRALLVWEGLNKVIVFVCLVLSQHALQNTRNNQPDENEHRQ